MKYTVLLFLSLFFLIPAQKTWAQDLSLTVKPSIIDFKRDKDQQAVVQITNRSNKPVTLTPLIFPLMDTKMKNGGLTIDYKDTKLQEKLEQAIIIRENQDNLIILEIEPLETKQISINYQKVNDIDKDAVFTIVFVDTASKEIPVGNTVSTIKGGIGSLIMLRGAASSETRISQFVTSGFNTKGPIELKAEITNPSDNIQLIRPQIKIKNVLGSTVGTISFPELYLLPQTSQILSLNDQAVNWNDSFLLGPYRAELALNAAENKTASFIVIPVAFVLIITAVLFVIIGVIFRAKKIR